jgi:hypothetical protein
MILNRVPRYVPTADETQEHHARIIKQECEKYLMMLITRQQNQDNGEPLVVHDRWTLEVTRHDGLFIIHGSPVDSSTEGYEFTFTPKGVLIRHVLRTASIRRSPYSPPMDR